MELARLESRPFAPAARPVAMAASRNGLDAIGSLITKTASGVPALRRSRLPAVISQGTRTPGQALAFAPPEVVARDELPELRRVDAPPRALGLRAALRASRSEASVTLPSSSTIVASTAPLNAVRLTGLRRAARALGEGAAL